MPFCNSCGKKVSEDDEFCPSCGNELKSKSVRSSPLSDKSSPVTNKLHWLIAVLLVIFFIYILFGRPLPAQPTQNRESIYEQQLALCGNGICDYGEGIYLDCPQDCPTQPAKVAGDFKIECSGSYQCPAELPVCINYRCQSGGIAPCDPHTSVCVVAKGK